jgi:parallel beta-helix repeat protein
MFVTQLHKANFFKKLLIGVGIFSIIIFLSGGDSSLSSKPWQDGGIVPSWSSAPIYIDGNAQLAAFCTGNGTGTPGSPYTITYAEITSAGASGAALYINNTSDYIVIENCTVQGANGADEVGIIINNCDHVVITNCTVKNNYIGVVLSLSANCSIEDSFASLNAYAGIGVTGSDECNVTRNIAFNNTIFGIGIVSCNNILISGNNVTLNPNAGIVGQYMADSVITENEIKDNMNYGILFSDSDDNNITSNVISGRQNGIIITAPGGPFRSERNQIFENNISYNSNYGIVLERANQNDIYLNNFVSNVGGQARVVTPGTNNHWNMTGLGNYYDDYPSRYPGATNDGITWDLPYIIPNLYIVSEVNRSYHALVSPVKPNHNAPALSGELVLPAVGNSSTLYWFTVIYTDSDNNYPIYVNVVVNGTPYAMTKTTPGDHNYTNGCIYQVGLYLQAGMNSYFFECADTKFTSTTVGYGKSVTGGNTNSPTLSGGTVFPAHGFNGTTLFDFSVMYTDADNSAPTFVQVVLNWGSTLTLNLNKENAFDTNYLDG